MVLTTFRIDKERATAPSSARSGKTGNEEREALMESGRGDSKNGDGKIEPGDDYSRQNVISLTRGRFGWLVTFCLGLLLSAMIVQRFEDLLEHHVQLSFFVPLVMGHGGNTGSQTVSTIIRALALRQVGQRDLLRTVIKETVAGCLMGALLGVFILILSLLWPNLGMGVGATVCVALPIISMWANAVGALLTMLADRFKLDPAVTSVPLMTTIVDASGLVIYFYIAELFLNVSEHAAAAHAAATAAAEAAASGKVAATAAVAAAAAAAAAQAAAANATQVAAAAANKAAAAVVKKPPPAPRPPPVKKAK